MLGGTETEGGKGKKDAANACKSDNTVGPWLRLGHRLQRSVNNECWQRPLEQRGGSARGKGEGKSTAPHGELAPMLVS